MIAQIEISNNLSAKLRVDGQEKSVPMVELTNILSNMITEDESPWLPNNLIYLRRDGGNVGAVYFFPETKTSYRYYDNSYDVILPPALFFFTLTALKNDKFRIVKMAAALTDSYNMQSSRLYQFPFPNNSLGYGPGFCWGSDRIAKDMYDKECTLEQLPILYQRFFAAQGNGDLGWKVQGSLEGKEACAKMLKLGKEGWTKQKVEETFCSVSLKKISEALYFDFTR